MSIEKKNPSGDRCFSCGINGNGQAECHWPECGCYPQAQQPAAAVSPNEAWLIAKYYEWKRVGEVEGTPLIVYLRREAAKAPPAEAVPDDVARDAARYRWLRNDSGNEFDDPVIQGKYIGSPKADWLTGEHADEAVDHAMLAAAERKGGES